MPLIEELVHKGKLKKADAKVEVKQLNRGVRMERIPYGKHTKKFIDKRSTEGTSLSI